MGGAEVWRASERRKMRGDDRAFEEVNARRQEHLQSPSDHEFDSEEEVLPLEERQRRNERELMSERRFGHDADGDADCDDERPNPRDQEAENLPGWLAEDNEDQVRLCAFSTISPSANSALGIYDGDDAALTGH